MRHKFPFWLLLVPALCLTAAVIVARWLFTLDINTLRQLESKSPAKLGTAILVTENISFGGSDAWVFVRDYQNTKPIKLGGSYASDGSTKMKQAVWSHDGTLFAVEAKVGVAAGKHFSKYYGTYLVAGYDFKRHSRFTAGSCVAASSRTLERLFRQRGGKGQIVLTKPYVTEGRQVSQREARSYGKLHPE